MTGFSYTCWSHARVRNDMGCVQEDKFLACRAIVCRTKADFSWRGPAPVCRPGRSPSPRAKIPINQTQQTDSNCWHTATIPVRNSHTLSTPCGPEGVNLLTFGVTLPLAQSVHVVKSQQYAEDHSKSCSSFWHRVTHGLRGVS